MIQLFIRAIVQNENWSLIKNTLADEIIIMVCYVILGDETAEFRTIQMDRRVPCNLLREVHHQFCDADWGCAEPADRCTPSVSTGTRFDRDALRYLGLVFSPFHHHHRSPLAPFFLLLLLLFSTIRLLDLPAFRSYPRP